MSAVPDSTVPITPDTVDASVNADLNMYVPQSLTASAALVNPPVDSASSSDVPAASEQTSLNTDGGSIASLPGSTGSGLLAMPSPADDTFFSRFTAGIHNMTTDQWLKSVALVGMAAAGTVTAGQKAQELKSATELRASQAAYYASETAKAKAALTNQSGMINWAAQPKSATAAFKPAPLTPVTQRTA